MTESTICAVNGATIAISSSYHHGMRTWGEFIATSDGMITISRQACPLDVLSYLVQFA